MNQPRGPLFDHVTVRLASEGVPVAAIARAIQRPSHELWPILREARERGDLAELPAADWPVGTRRDRLPTLAPIRSRDIERLVTPLCALYRLTSQEARAFGVLIVRREASRADLHLAMSDPRLAEVTTEPKIVDVIICKIRKKMSRFGVEIETSWGCGYRLSKETVDRIMAEIARRDDSLNETSEALATFLESPRNVERVADCSLS
jgi:hypothetical protein